jgi:uncharacterized sulfatase
MATSYHPPEAIARRLIGVWIASLGAFTAWNASVEAQVAPDRSASQRLNVLLIIADDANVSLGCYGHPSVKTPNLDRLAARGVRFERAYCQYPYCNPSRASLLTGLRPQTTGVQDNGSHVRDRLPEVVTLPQFFRQHGYLTARFGKIFHQAVPEDIVRGTAGLDDSSSWDVAWNAQAPEYQTAGESHNQTPHIAVPERSSTAFLCIAAEGDERQQADYQIATQAAEWLAQSRKEPFFLAVGFVRPHVPLVAPKRFFDLYPQRDPDPLESLFDDRADIPPPALTGKQPDYGMNAEQRHLARRGYYASMSFMDAQVGRVLQTLEQQRLAGNTLVVFLGDHGYHLGEHQLWQKLSLFEESTRVPLLVAAPQMPAQGQACSSLVELVDLFPTLAELCGLRPPKDLEGRSFKPLLSEPQLAGKEAAYSEVSRGKIQGRSVRTVRWRYTQWDGKQAIEAVELYDHDTDPREQTNLAHDPRYARQLAEMQRHLRRGWPGAFEPTSSDHR